jgi:hypothetical protein
VIFSVWSFVWDLTLFNLLPLVKSASFILLQGVPTSITLEDLREDIRRVRGVTSLHELHVWQLSESKIIASVHVCVDRSVEYMKVAAAIREVLHDYNVHSCTIQPEYDPVDNDGKPIQKTVRCSTLFIWHLIPSSGFIVADCWRELLSTSLPSRKCLSSTVNLLS